jgi:membrane dipeptidase
MSATLPWGRLAAAEGQAIVVEGWLLAAPEEGTANRILVPDAGCCIGCRPDPARAIELLPEAPLPPGTLQLRLAGELRQAPPGDPAGWRWQLHGARSLGRVSVPGPWLARRALLTLPLACAACTAPSVHAQPAEAARALIAAGAPMDLHSHAGHVLISRVAQRPLSPVAEPMREGGMALIALATVADTPVTTVTQDRRIVATREPGLGELYEHFQRATARAAQLVAEQQLHVVTDRAGLADAVARRRGPAVVMASEGADFLEGNLGRVEEAFARHRLRHLQLTHYRVNELGDIQTADPVHDGLSDFGAQVIRECNRLGIVVDIAHGTEALVRRAAMTTTKPLVLSHTSLTARPGRYSRQVSADHARRVSGTGGVIGVWPPVTIFADLTAFSAGIARLVDVVGIDHVGIGTDMLGLLSAAVFEDYRATPAVAQALLSRGFSTAEASAILGGNYARVLAQVLPA